MQQCMGGWCKRREECQHYRAPQVPGHAPIERMCAPGEDRPLVVVEVVRRRELEAA